MARARGQVSGNAAGLTASLAGLLLMDGAVRETDDAAGATGLWKGQQRSRSAGD